MFWLKKQSNNVLFPILAVGAALAIIAGAIIFLSRTVQKDGDPFSIQNSSNADTPEDVIAAYRQAMEEIATLVVDASAPLNQSLDRAEQGLLQARAPVGALDRHFAVYIAIDRFMNDPSVDPAFARHTILQLLQDLLAEL